VVGGKKTYRKFGSRRRLFGISFISMPFILLRIGEGMYVVICIWYLLTFFQLQCLKGKPQQYQT
jgi:hypothetical protein